jgi:hypothetical protein
MAYTTGYLFLGKVLCTNNICATVKRTECLSGGKKGAGILISENLDQEHLIHKWSYDLQLHIPSTLEPYSSYLGFWLYYYVCWLTISSHRCNTYTMSNFFKSHCLDVGVHVILNTHFVDNTCLRVTKNASMNLHLLTLTWGSYFFENMMSKT